MIGSISSTPQTILRAGAAPRVASSQVESEVAISDQLDVQRPTSPPTETLAQVAQQTALEAAGAATPGPFNLKVLSLNIRFDGEGHEEEIAQLIKGTKADLVGLQESVRSTAILAKKLGMHFRQQDKRTALLSRFPIDSTTPKRYGVAVTLPNGAKVGFCNAHLTSFPFQSHQLLHLPTGGGPYIDTEEEAIAEAEKARGKEVRTMIQEANDLKLPVIATGDFNEPSHRDWTQAAHESGRHPIKCQWPASSHFEEAGFIDSYREKYPNEMTHPGNTWTPTAAQDDPKEHHDRIDFVHHRGQGLTLKDIQIVGEKPEFADIVVDPYPSDHRGVLATFEVAPPL